MIVTAPAVFRFTASACPERHIEAASLLGADVTNVKAEDAGKLLSDTLLKYMDRLKVRNVFYSCLRPVGVEAKDIAINAGVWGFDSLGRSDRTQCRQRLVIAAMFLQSCDARTLRRGDGPRHSLHASA